jgi:hypothetical protein
MQFKYGGKPEVIDNMKLYPEEYCYIQYLPIKMAGSDDTRMPANLGWVYRLVWDVAVDVKYRNIKDDLEDKYVYLTAKHFYVDNASAANREGWHSDGFMSDDINYIWYSDMPTQFCEQEFWLSHGHSKSMLEMEQQALLENIVEYPCGYLLRVDEKVIHRVNPDSNFKGVRTFVKVSISDKKYNLKGNAHNYLFDYDWDMVERGDSRNDPVGLISDTRSEAVRLRTVNVEG